MCLSLLVGIEASSRCITRWPSISFETLLNCMAIHLAISAKRSPHCRKVVRCPSVDISLTPITPERRPVVGSLLPPEIEISHELITIDLIVAELIISKFVTTRSIANLGILLLKISWSNHGHGFLSSVLLNIAQLCNQDADFLHNHDQFRDPHEVTLSISCFQVFPSFSCSLEVQKTLPDVVTNRKSNPAKNDGIAANPWLVHGICGTCMEREPSMKAFQEPKEQQGFHLHVSSRDLQTNTPFWVFWADHQRLHFCQ
ncbi:unnamed protein product [Linum tenue]|uniref:Uncharacterized protein n=1 Tax=Linum tenue TaxID=586396 RepID=A0AAV0IRU7_9ROSI|nr:unnamed protein product [Linum tenue]